MFQVGIEWNPLQAKLKEIIFKKDRFDEVKQLLHQMHSLVHSNSVYGNKNATFMEEIWEGLDDKAFRTMLTVKDDTVAWNIWHITRIEDLTSNYLIGNGNQLLDAAWLKKLSIDVKDTGNAMSDPEIIDFSAKVNRDALYEYCNAVGFRTKEIIESLKPEDMKRKAAKEGLEKIAEAGGVTQQPDAP